MEEFVNVSVDESFTRKISVLYESPPLWNEENFNNIKNLKNCKDKLEKMSNVSYYIKSDDLSKVISNTKEKVYLRLVIDSPYKYSDDSMSISDSPGRTDSHGRTRIDSPGRTDAPGRTRIDSPGRTNSPGRTSIDSPGRTLIDSPGRTESPGRSKNSSSKSSDNIKVKKSRKSTRLTRSTKSIDNSDDSTCQEKKTISIKSKTYLLYFIKDDEKRNTFVCDMKDDIIFFNFINGDDIKGSKLDKLLSYESTDVNIGDKIITISSPSIKDLTFPIYFILHKYELTIYEFVSIMESVLESVIACTNI